MGGECDFDVIVVGCGPVGGFAGNLFGARGLRCLVVEDAIAIHNLPRAVHIDHEMMRLLHSVGLSEALKPLMREAQGHVHIGADGGVIRYMGTAGDTRRFGWANDYFFFQPELDAVLRAGIAALDSVTLRLGTRVTSLRQNADRVAVTLQDAVGAEVVTAKYVVACDGARSTVRRALNIELDDLGFEEPWLVVDAEVDGPIRFPDYVGLPVEADLQQLSVMICDPCRPTTAVPGRGDHRRWEFMLLPDEDDAQMMSPDVVAGLIAPWVDGASHRIIRAATYRFHGLIARQWREGRVFLAGDAAHQTPPFFGQGMCHGFRDVSNLAWKLDLVLKDVATVDLLETYATERDPHVRSVVGLAIDAGQYICQLDPVLAADRDARLRSTAATEAPSDIIPSYRSGVLGSGSGVRFIQPDVFDATGRRLMLDDFVWAAQPAGFALLARGDAAGWIPSPQAQRVIDALGLVRFALDQTGGLQDVDHALGAWLDQRGADAVVLRPDAYVYGVAADPGDLESLILQLGWRLKPNETSLVDKDEHRCIA